MIRKPIDEAVSKEWVHLHKVIKHKIITATVSGKYCLETGRARKEEKEKKIWGNFWNDNYHRDCDHGFTYVNIIKFKFKYVHVNISQLCR